MSALPNAFTIVSIFSILPKLPFVKDVGSPGIPEPNWALFSSAFAKAVVTAKLAALAFALAISAIVFFKDKTVLTGIIALSTFHHNANLIILGPSACITLRTAVTGVK